MRQNRGLCGAVGVSESGGKGMLRGWNGYAAGKRKLQIQITLVPAATKKEGEVPLLGVIGAVDEEIRFF